MYRGLHATGLFFNLTEANDVIIHDTLLDNLNSYDIRIKQTCGLNYILTCQVQCVEINQTDHKNSIQNRYISTCRDIKC